MKVVVALVVLCMPAVVLAGGKCTGTAELLTPFKGGAKKDSQKPKVPCKYRAVQQICGDYIVTVTPGNLFLSPHYRLGTLWLSISQKDGDQQLLWEGHASNTNAVKYINGWRDFLFSKSAGSMETSDILTAGKSRKSTWVDSTDNVFRVTFTPWEPNNPKYKVSSWKFKCSHSFEAEVYPVQLCGDRNTKENRLRRKNLGLKEAYQLVFYDIFTNVQVKQTNPQCAEVTRLLTAEDEEDACKTSKQRTDTITACSDILYSNQHRACATRYSCDPMDIFVACVQWTCSGYTNKDACQTVARGIDMCRNFVNGNLTARVEEANCLRDFHPINATFVEDQENGS